MEAKYLQKQKEDEYVYFHRVKQRNCKKNETKEKRHV